MGRPPIGKRAMTGAERTRRHREKLRRSNHVTKPTASVALVERIREIETDYAALWTAMEKHFQALAQRLANLSNKKARLSFLSHFREFKAEIARLRARREARPDLASLSKSKAKRPLDKVLDGRKPLVPMVTGYRRHAIWLLDPASNEVVAGPLVFMAGRAKAQAKRTAARAARGRARVAT
jgi:hypothetical protein